MEKGPIYSPLTPDQPPFKGGRYLIEKHDMCCWDTCCVEKQDSVETQDMCWVETQDMCWNCIIMNMCFVFDILKLGCCFVYVLVVFMCFWLFLVVFMCFWTWWGEDFQNDLRLVFLNRSISKSQSKLEILWSKKSLILMVICWYSYFKKLGGGHSENPPPTRSKNT